ncbi:GyrI-like domain-containing protein [Saccharibacillus sacchari]|uniref:GyrI-like domain-containing protein n=1 Tax=Saccharibacillus sacchari TaxID=456493 RepID=UPI0004B3EF21|nr:GyrI-like domain-containing protein [Saccharibacillus sacchari]
MNVRIAETQASKAVGVSTKIVDPYREIAVFAEQIWNDGRHDRVNETVGRPIRTMLSGYHYDFREDGTRQYMMGTELEEEVEVPSDLTVIDIPGGSYAVFEMSATQPDDQEIDTQIQDLWRRIYSEWFPSSRFEQAEGPCIETYAWTDEASGDYKSEIWIPVRIKA